MRHRYNQGVVVIILMALVYIGGDTPGDIVLLVPTAADPISYDQGKIFVLSAVKDTTGKLTAAQQWERTRYFDYVKTDKKENFPKEFLKLFDSSMTIQKIWFVSKYQNLLARPESVQYKYTDTMTVRKFWGTSEFAYLFNAVKDVTTERLLVVVRGWKDSSYTTPYDDPNADNRALFKLQLHLIPGVNSIYFSPAGRKKDALEYSTNLVNESKLLEERDGRFHNSEMEKNCSTCHEGLPSTDSGKSMKADCSVCHKAIATASTVHSPVEMKECITCHSWSQEKNSMVVTKGIPDACFDCHKDKKTLIDSAKVQHPVASECTTCHSPHASSEAPHLLKKNIYDLCTTCHEDYKLNHPVGRHPMRFTKAKTGEEISCISCHTPHGSENDHLLAVGGNSMMVCAKCH